MIDPLSAFRKGAPAAPSAPGGSGTAKEEYVAFGAKDRVTRLRIRRAMAPTRSPGYIYLRDVAYDGTYGTNFALDFTFILVLVRGRNLQSLVTALEAGMADFIQEFDADKWRKPTDPTAAVIDTIEIVTPEAGGPKAAPGADPDSVTH